MPEYNEALDFRQLAKINFNFNQPFKLSLENDESVFLDKVVRVMPGKRLVAFGTWRNKEIVAKIFFDASKALMQANKESNGFAILKKRKILTPELYCHGVSEDRRVHVLIYEKIVATDHLTQLASQHNNEAKLMTLLELVMKEIATQHVLGILQKDLHLDNFLISHNQVYTLDVAQITVVDTLASKKDSMENISMLLSQLGITRIKMQQSLFEYYVKTRGWVVSDKEAFEYRCLMKCQQDKRWLNYLKKIFRNSTEFALIKKPGKYGVRCRQVSTASLLQIMEDPELAFQQPDRKILKAGRSSTVIKIEVEGRQYVVKRFNLKNSWHRLRRCLRSSRAAHGWRIANKMKFFGIQTARPLAFIENRFCGLRGTSYLIMDYIDGIRADEYIRQHEEQKQEIIERIVDLLKNLARLELTHGDLKITNILVDREGVPFLIDLDGSQEHFSANSLQTAWQKEIDRFLENFHDDAALQHRFRDLLQ